MTAPTDPTRPVKPPAKPFRSVWFDCDSTLSTIEGIDELALRAGPEVAERVARLTDDAMNGSLPLERVYGARLDAIRPDRAACEEIGRRYVARAVSDAGEVCAALRSLGKRLGILSGGLRACVLPLAEHLGIASEQVHAVELHFDATGGYAGFDVDCPLARSGGKPLLLRRLLDADARPAALVGDGITDLETADVLDRFVGFGGVVTRESVASRASHWAAGPGLATALPHLLTPDETYRLQHDPRFGHLIEPPASPPA